MASATKAAAGHSRLTLGVASVLMLASTMLAYEVRGGSSNSMWDLDAYTRAVHDYAAGRNPYRTDVSDLFVYPPVVLVSMLSIDTMLAADGGQPHANTLDDCPLRWALLSFYLVTAIAFLWQLANFTFEHVAAVHAPNGGHWGLMACIFGALGYGQAGATAYLSGNLTASLHLAVLAVLLKFIRSEDQRYVYAFVATTAVASVIKPYMLAYVSVCLLLTTRRRAVSYVTAALAVVAGSWLAAIALWQDESGSFLTALRQQTLTADDLGYSVLGLTQPLLANGGALFAHLVVLGMLAWLCWVGIPRRLGLEPTSGSRYLLLAAWAILANPRMKEYDLFAAILCLFTVLYLCVPRRALLIVCSAVLVAAVPLVALQLRRMGYGAPVILADAHHFEVAGLLFIGVGLWRAPMDAAVSGAVARTPSESAS